MRVSDEINGRQVELTVAI